MNPGDKTAEAGSRRSTRRTKSWATRTSARSTTSSAPTGGCTNRQARGGRRNPFGGAPPGRPVRARGYRTMTPEEMEELFGDANPFSDFFTTFFGGGGVGARRAGARHARSRTRRPGPRHRARDRAGARGRVQRRDAPAPAPARRTGEAVDVRIPAGVTTVRACASPVKANKEPAAHRSGDLFLRVRLRRIRVSSGRGAISTSRCGAGDDRRPRRRGAGARRSRASRRDCAFRRSRRTASCSASRDTACHQWARRRHRGPLRACRRPTPTTLTPRNVSITKRSGNWAATTHDDSAA